MQDPAAGRNDGGSIFDDIRRQMEEMLSGRRPPGPQVITQRPVSPARPETPDIGMIATTVGAYWLLAIAAARRRRRARPPDTPAS